MFIKIAGRFITGMSRLSVYTLLSKRKMTNDLPSNPLLF
jgi:hypothetical protein